MEPSLFYRIDISKGDITRFEVDAVVNAANSSLLGGGGVDGAIHRAAGPELLEQCRTVGGCPTGEARITKGFRLPAKFVIHTVGPVYRGKAQDPKLLQACYRSSLALALENNIRTIAFPAISCGIYGYPIAEAADIALGTTLDVLKDHPELEKVVFVLFSRRDLDIYQARFDAVVRL